MGLYIRCVWQAGLALLFCAPLAQAESAWRGVEEGNNTVPILALIGGFNSCPSIWTGDIHESNMGIASRRLLTAIKADSGIADAEYVVSCFTRSRSNVRFVTSYDDGEYHYQGDVDTMVAEITTLASRHTNHRVYLAGHSYGGWLAMYLVEHLPAWVDVRVLMTLDPISTVNCGPTTFIRSYLNSAWQLNPVPGCTQPPSDLSEVEISGRASKWLNFYQATYPMLHSGFIGHADVNDMLDFDTTYLLEFQAHVWMEEDPRVWNPFNHEVAFDLAID